MSNDLSKLLLKYCDDIGLQSHTINEVCGGIVQLERELGEEKALADRLYNSKQYGQHDPHSDEAYRKARGL